MFRFISLIILLAIRLQAAVWYVDGTVGSGHNGTSWALAWHGIGNITGVSAGDTIYFSGNATGSSQTYNTPTTFWTPVGGTSGNPITYAVGQDSAHNGTVIINTPNAHWLSPTGSFTGWITFDGNVGGVSHLQTTATGSLTSEWVVISNVSGVVFRYVTFGTGDAINFSNVNQYEISNCFIHGNTDHGVKITLTPAASGYGVNSIHDNTFLLDQDSGGSGLGVDGIQSAYSVDIYNNQFLANPVTYGGSQHQDAWQSFSGNYSRFWNNTVVSMSNSGVYMEPESNFSNVQVYNNLVYMNTNLHAGGLQEGIQITAQSGGWAISNVLVANNTIVNFGNKCLYAPDQFSATWSNVTFVNNVCYGTPIDISGPGITQTTNAHYTTGGTSLFTTYADPTSSPFVYNFVPAPGSALIGAGTNLTSLGVFNTDFAGTNRPATAAWDIGAYQVPSGSFWTGLSTVIGNVTIH